MIKVNYKKCIEFVMMMMIAPNSLVCQKERAHGEEEEEAASGRRAGSTGTPTPGADAPIGPTRSGCRMRETGENMDGGKGSNPQEGQRRLGSLVLQLWKKYYFFDRGRMQIEKCHSTTATYSPAAKNKKIMQED